MSGDDRGTARAAAGEGGALERWALIESRLRALEETYRVERIRKNGRPRPEGESLRLFFFNVTSASEIYMDTTTDHRASIGAQRRLKTPARYLATFV